MTERDLCTSWTYYGYDPDLGRYRGICWHCPDCMHKPTRECDPASVVEDSRLDCQHCGSSFEIVSKIHAWRFLRRIE